MRTALAVALTALFLETWAAGAGALSDQWERPRRGITPDPLPDGESEEVQEGERRPASFDFLVANKAFVESAMFLFPVAKAHLHRRSGIEPFKSEEFEFLFGVQVSTDQALNVCRNGKPFRLCLLAKSRFQLWID